MTYSYVSDNGLLFLDCNHHFQMTTRINSVYIIRSSTDGMWTEGNLKIIYAKYILVFRWIQTFSSQYELEKFRDGDASVPERTNTGTRSITKNPVKGDPNEGD